MSLALADIYCQETRDSLAWWQSSQLKNSEKTFGQGMWGLDNRDKSCFSLQLPSWRTAYTCPPDSRLHQPRLSAGSWAKGVKQLWQNLDRGPRDQSPGSPAGIHKRKNGLLTATDPGWRDPSRLVSKRLRHRELAALFTEHRNLVTSRSITRREIIRNCFFFGHPECTKPLVLSQHPSLWHTERNYFSQLSLFFL